MKENKMLNTEHTEGRAQTFLIALTGLLLLVLGCLFFGIWFRLRSLEEVHLAQEKEAVKIASDYLDASNAWLIAEAFWRSCESDLDSASKVIMDSVALVNRMVLWEAKEGIRRLDGRWEAPLSFLTVLNSLLASLDSTNTGVLPLALPNAPSASVSLSPKMEKPAGTPLETDEVLEKKVSLLFRDAALTGIRIKRNGDVITDNNIRRASHFLVQVSLEETHGFPMGTQTLYFLIHSPARIILSESPEHLFSASGHMLPYTLKKTVNYRGQEMLVTAEIPIPKGLPSGQYACEIYWDGVISATCSTLFR